MEHYWEGRHCLRCEDRKFNHHRTNHLYCQDNMRAVFLRLCLVAQDTLLYSLDGAVQLLMQGDGNFVL